MYNSVKNNIIKLISFIILYNYNPELIRNVKNIKIIIKKVRMSVS